MILVSSFIILFYSFGIYPKLIVRKEIFETSLSLNSITLYPFVSVQKDSVNIHLEHPVVSDFMFTSCGPCLKKLTYLQAIMIRLSVIKYKTISFRSDFL
ncbi:thiol-disulfide isomerase/thioredoxin [Sphingobacterium sp. HSC-15S19]